MTNQQHKIESGYQWRLAAWESRNGRNMRSRRNYTITAALTALYARWAV